jgi:mono/diheme cytochrome c family protein
MKKVLKIIGITIGVLLFFILGFTGFINFSDSPDYSSIEIPNLTVELTPEKIERGEKIVHSVCWNCHADNNILEGKYFNDLDAESTFGVSYASNLTQHETAGIGNYSDGEMYRLLRTGVSKNGQLNSVIMPSLVKCSDEDIHSIIAYLRSDKKAVQASGKIHPVHQKSFLEKMLRRFVFKPYEYQKSYPKNPPLEDSIAYGKYIVDSEAFCFACHSEDIETIDLLNPEATPNYLGGGYTFLTKEYEILVPSIKMNDESNVSKWTKAEFINAVKNGIRPDKSTYLFPMHPFAHLSEEEVAAVYYYLKSIKGTGNK